MARQKAADEIFCRSCGDRIKEQAEICPHCGVRNDESAGANRTGTGAHASQSAGIDGIAPYVAWGGGLMLLLTALGVLVEPNGQIGRAIVGSTVLAASGLFSLPPVRERLTARTGTRFERGLVVAIVLAGLIVGAGLSPS